MAFFDNIVMLAGAIFGLSIDSLFPRRGTGVIVGALAGNAISDGLAGLLVANVGLGIGSFLGASIVLIGYLIVLKFRRKIK